MDKLDTLQKTRLSSGVSQAEKKIDEIEKNLPADTFPPFKRDDKGNVIEPEKQLEEFQVMLVRVATYEDRRFRGDNRESPYPSIHAIAQWPPQTSANRSVGEFIKAVHLVNDMNFFLTFRAILPPVSDPVDLAAVAHAGRKQLTRENFSGINDWTSSLHNGSFVPPEIKYFKNLENLSFRLSIDYLPRSLESLKRLHTLNLVGPGNLTEVPDVVWKLKFLKNLFLDFNRIHSLSPKVRELEKLKNLSLSSNQLTEIPRLPSSLTFLNLSKNTIEILDLSNLASLEQLMIDKNPDNAVESIGECVSLVKLYCSANQLPHLPIELGQSKNLTDIIILPPQPGPPLPGGWRNTLDPPIPLEGYIKSHKKKDKVS